jgi:hypothetical protein
MVFARKVPSSSPPLVVISGDMPRSPAQPKVHRSDEESSRMGDEGCPNESPSVEDATGYSREEEEVNAMSCEEVL